MRTFYEIVAFDILPALRSILTHELMRVYGFNQIEISHKLGITQPAVSQYRHGLRGNGVKKLKSNGSIMEMIKKLSSEIATKNLKYEQINERIHEICETIRKDLSVVNK